MSEMYIYENNVQDIKGDNMHDDIYLLIGKNIKKFRMKKGYSLKDLSLMTNISIDDLQTIEDTGVSGNISFDTLNLVASSLDIKLVELFKE